MKISDIQQIKADSFFLNVYPAEKRHLRPPWHFGNRQANFSSRINLDIPALGVAIINNGSIFRDGWIIDGKGHIIPELSWYVHEYEYQDLPVIPETSKFYNGIAVNLASTWSHANHGHFLIDSLCRYHIFQKAGFLISDVDYLYCAEPAHDFHQLLYQRLALNPEKIIYVRPGQRIQFDLLLAPSFPGIKSQHASWVADFMRKTFLNHPLPQAQRRLYLNRDGYKRQVVNQQDLLNVLHDFDFEIIDPLTVSAQHVLFSQASIIITIHGSALANIVFCQPGAKILDLMPENHVTSFAWSLAQAGGLEYYYLLCNNVSRRAAGATGPDYGDFTVDIPVLEAALRQLCTK